MITYAATCYETWKKMGTPKKQESCEKDDMQPSRFLQRNCVRFTHFGLYPSGGWISF